MCPPGAGHVRAVARFAGHTDGIACVAFCPGDASLVATCSEDGAVLAFDTRAPASSPALALSLPAPTGALAWDTAPGGRTLYVSSGACVHGLDSRAPLPAGAPLLLYEAAEEVNSLAAGRAWLAAASDDGAVAVLDVGAAPGLPSQPPPARVLPWTHSNICAAVAPRPHRRNEVVSGGLDCLVARWDVSARCLLHRWDAGAVANAAGIGLSSVPGGPLVNPPFVHSVATPTRAAQPAAAAVAAACGNGSVLVLDGDATGGPRRRLAPSASALTVLDRTLGGHSRPATCVAFVDAAAAIDAMPLLASGGDDSRLLLWAWDRATSEGEAGRVPRWRNMLRSSGDGEPLAAAVAHGAKLQALAPGEGGALVVGDVDGGVTLYQLLAG